jgi:hypothetical protein
MPFGSELEYLDGYRFEVRYSDGSLARAKAVADLAEAGYVYFSRMFAGVEPDIAVIVAREADWSSRLPYGMAFFNDDPGQIRPGVLVLPAGGGDFWLAIAHDIHAASPGGYATLRAVYPDGVGGVDLQPFCDLITIHELAHAFETLGDLRLPTLWLSEIFVNLALHAFVAAQLPASLPTLETLPTLGAGSRELAARMRSEGYSTLEELQAHYSASDDAMSPLNYVWFQYRWQRLAAEVFEDDGEDGLVRFWSCFHANDRVETETATAASLAPLLETQVSRTLGQAVRDRHCAVGRSHSSAAGYRTMQMAQRAHPAGWLRGCGSFATMAVGRLVLGGPRVARSAGSEEPDGVELYHRTYTTLLRSSGETHLRVLEPSHRAMRASLHPFAGEEMLDLGAFLYCVRRLPEEIIRGHVVLLGQDRAVFATAGINLDDWREAEAAARRRHWFDGGTGRMAVLLSSASDLDDLVPTLVAYQIEWNKLHGRLRGSGWNELAADLDPAACPDALGGGLDDWQTLAHTWGARFAQHLGAIAARALDLRIRMLGGTHIGYARLTREWWGPAHACIEHEDLADRPVYFVSSNTHSLSNLVTGIAREHEPDLISFVEHHGPTELREELAALREGRAPGAWENFLYFLAREYFDVDERRGAQRRRAERAAGVMHLPARTSLRVPVQIIPLDRLDSTRLDSRLGEVDAARLRASRAVIVNIDYPLGLAAYNILREVAIDVDALRGVYLLGKAATLNADVGDVMISNVVYDEHSGTTFWLDNAFAFDDIEPDLRYGTGLDNQRAVTVRSTFLQNRTYLDFYYREAFTVVEMEAGPYCSAIYEIADVERHPVGEAVNFSRLPIDFGLIHYASDTPFTQARTLGARGLSYYGMDSTYAASLAILRRILRLERILPAKRDTRAGEDKPAS